MMPAWAGVTMVLALLVMAMGGLHAARRRWAWHPEVVRKLLHVGMGLVSLSFPWMFGSSLPVIVLAALVGGGLLALRLWHRRHGGVGGVLHDVRRDSLGEVHFALSVVVLFVLGHDTPVLYVIPLLILTLADAVAALVGVRYGLTRFTAGGDRKSAEGSLAFFLTAFLSTHVPLLLFTGTGRLESLLIAMILGVLVMLLEAVAWRGLDNLFIPLGGFALLKAYLDMTPGELGLRLAVVLALAAGVMRWRRHTTLDHGGALAAVLAGYVGWALGGASVLLPLVVLYLVYPLAYARGDGRISAVHHDARAVFCVLSPGLGWFWLAHAAGLGWRALSAGVLALAVELGIILAAGLRARAPSAPRWGAVATGVAAGWGGVYVPWFLLTGGGGSWAVAATALALLAAALPLFEGWRRWTTRGEERGACWWAQWGVAGGIPGLHVLGVWSLVR